MPLHTLQRRITGDRGCRPAAIGGMIGMALGASIGLPNVMEVPFVFGISINVIALVFSGSQGCSP